MERRLAAIVAADVAEYSRLIGVDEEGTLEQLKAHLRELIDPKIAEHQGRLVKTTGDGVLIEFASAVKAVRCAIDVQRGMADRNAECPRERRIEFRIGINLGDVVVDEGDIFGDGVNVAARLEGIADPGTVYISQRRARSRPRQSRDRRGGPGREGAQEHRQAGPGVPHRHAGSRRERAAGRIAARARQAVDRRAAVRQHERRRLAGILL